MESTGECPLLAVALVLPGGLCIPLCRGELTGLGAAGQPSIAHHRQHEPGAG